MYAVGWRLSTQTADRRTAVHAAVTVACAVAIASCATSELPQSDAVVPDGSSAPSQSASPVESAPVASPTPISSTTAADLVISQASAGIDIDRRLLGTNLPAWLGPERLGDPELRRRTIESGTTMLRMPGGSWSNAYDLAACELGEEACPWPWGARPSDFASFVAATELDAMWTVSINHTAQAAAASVAFFNGDVDDDRVIGLDRNGVDWATVGTWAQLRADGGNPDPVRVDLWEVGNEVYGGKPEAGGSECASFGWETVWTCDGTEYVLGDGDHDGYLEIRAAMLEVDSSIQVGAVGVSDPDGWSQWGREVIESSGADLDFYVVHDYGFDRSPNPEQAANRPLTMWPEVMDDVERELPQDVPVAITEYNLVAFEEGDSEQAMTRAMNALFLADSIGQMALRGVDIANQWNLANGVTSSGTDYGMVDADSFEPTPQYEAMRVWGRAGSTLHPVETTHENLRIYPTAHDDGRWTIIVINTGDTDISTAVEIEDLPAGSAVEIIGATAAAPTDTAMVALAGSEFSTEGSGLSIDLPAWSIAAIEVNPNV